MTHFLFTSAPLPGHLDWGGYLRTAAALRRAGHEVTWVSTPAVAGQLAEAHVPLTTVPTTGWHIPPPAPADLPPNARAWARQVRAIDSWLDVAEVAKGVTALDQVVADLRPDVIASELFVTAAPIVAEKYDIPLVICGWPAQAMRLPARTTPDAASQVAHEARARLAQLWERAHVAGRYWTDGGFWPVSPHGHVVYFSRSWYSEKAALLPHNQFVGGQTEAPAGTPPAWMETLPADRPLVMVTLGSLFTHDEDFFVAAAQAVLHVGGCPIVVAGSQEWAAQLRSQLPPAAIVQPWVAYDWLLPRLDLVIHHGGVGTTHAAIVHGVPQLIIPHAGDQANQARRAAAAGIALTLPATQVTAAELLPVVARLLKDPRWREHATAWQNEFARLGGVDQAARWMSQL